MHCACATLSSVSCLAVQYFSILSHKRHDFRGGKFTEHKNVFRFSLQRLSEPFLILGTIQRDIIRKYVLVESTHHILRTFEFSWTDIRKNTQIAIS